MLYIRCCVQNMVLCTNRFRDCTLTQYPFTCMFSPLLERPPHLHYSPISFLTLDPYDAIYRRRRGVELLSRLGMQREEPVLADSNRQAYQLNIIIKFHRRKRSAEAAVRHVISSSSWPLWSRKALLLLLLRSKLFFQRGCRDLCRTRSLELQQNVSKFFQPTKYHECRPSSQHQARFLPAQQPLNLLYSTHIPFSP